MPRMITRSYDRDKKVAAEVATVVTGMETLFPERTAVFQFPITDFPADFNRGQMLAYDHSLPYLRTDHFRWSWPALTPRHVGWTRFIASRSRAPRLCEPWRDAGFGAVWVDRFGYRDRGRAITASVLSAGGVEVLAGHQRAIRRIRHPGRRRSPTVSEPRSRHSACRRAVAAVHLPSGTLSAAMPTPGGPQMSPTPCPAGS